MVIKLNQLTLKVHDSISAWMHCTLLPFAPNDIKWPSVSKMCPRYKIYSKLCDFPHFERTLTVGLSGNLSIYTTFHLLPFRKQSFNHIPLWLSLIGLVTHRMSMMDVFYAVAAERFSSLDLKYGAIHNHKVPTFYDCWTARIC